MPAGTVTVTPSPSAGPVKAIVIAWTSDAAGAVDQVINSKNLPNGVAWGCRIENGTGGSQPTTGYNATLRDAHGTDVLNGLGANIDSSQDTALSGEDMAFAPIAGDLTLAISSAGNTKSGSLILYIQE